MTATPNAKTAATRSGSTRASAGSRVAALRQMGMRLRNLLTLGLLAGARPPASETDLSLVYIELTTDGARLRLADSPQVVDLEDSALAMAAADGVEALDLVLSGDSCFDLAFSLPDSPVADLRTLIDSEIQFRSPFSADVSRAFWIAHERPEGGWRVTAAIALREKIDPLIDAMTAQGLTPGVVRRNAAKARFAARPDWALPAALVRPDWHASWSGLPVVLRAAVLGVALVLTTTSALWLQSGIRASDVEARSAAASADLSRMARAAAEARAVTDALDASTTRIALLGQMTNALPDGVWLDQFLIDDATLTVAGFAPSAADVTRQMSALPELNNIAFASPVVRDNSQSIERFRITADIAELTP